MESNSEKKKMTPVLKVTIAFICAAIVLTFFSKTMYNAGLPTVEVAAVKSSVLNVKYTGEGVVSPKETAALYAPGDLVVTDVLVEKYDTVAKGDVLAAFDVSALENQLLDMQTAYEKLLSSRKNTSGETRRLMDMDVADMERHMENLKKQIDEGSALIAPFDGVVTEVSASKGMMANRSSPLFLLGSTEQGYVVKQVVTDKNAGYYTKADVYLTESEVKTRISGTVTERTPAGDGGFELTIELEPGRAQLMPDMPVKFELSGKTENFPTVVPASAVVDGAYVYLLVKTDGPLGEEHRVRRIPVEVKAQTWEFAAVTGELIPVADRVVVRSDSTLSDERVKIAH